MGIVNRRNAVLGWTAWQVGKRVIKRRARAAVPGTQEGSWRPNKAALVALLAAAAGGALWFWRRRGEDEASEWTPPSND